jgi:uncharacterized DUF497 family protein
LKYEWDAAKNRANFDKRGTPRDEGTRIISMRKGNRREQEIYQERLGAN